MKTKQKNIVHYDASSDVLYLEAKPGIEKEYIEIAPGISVELDDKGNSIGIEILNASKVLKPVTRSLERLEKVAA